VKSVKSFLRLYDRNLHLFRLFALNYYSHTFSSRRRIPVIVLISIQLFFSSLNVFYILSILSLYKQNWLTNPKDISDSAHLKWDWRVDKLIPLGLTIYQETISELNNTSLKCVYRNTILLGKVWNTKFSKL